MKKTTLILFSFVIFLMCVLCVSFASATISGYPDDWQCGDTHTHSKYSISEGTLDISSIQTAATAKNLDFFFVTDHGPEIDALGTCWKKFCVFGICGNVPYLCMRGEFEWNNIIRECSAYENSRAACYLGVEEMNSYYIWLMGLSHRTDDHLIGAGMPASSCIDCGIHFNNYYHNCGANINCISKWHILETNSVGAVSIIAHPGTWNSWNIPEMNAVEGIEVMNGESTGNSAIDEATVNRLIEYYDARTSMSQNVPTPIGSSDMCTQLVAGCGGISYIGSPRTCCKTSLSRSNVMNAIRNGNCEATKGQVLDISINYTTVGQSTIIMAGNTTVSLTAYSTSEFGELTNQVIKIYYNGAQITTTQFLTSECTMTSNITTKCTKSITIQTTYDIQKPLQYVFAKIDNQLITSPIWLIVNPAP